MSVNRNSVFSMMNEIALLADVKPDVYRVSLTRERHTDAFIAYVTFRGSVAHLQSLEARGNTPESALSVLLDTLEQRFGRCETCGGYRDGEGE